MKKVTIILAVVIVLLLGVLFFVNPKPGSPAPGGSNATSPDGRVNVATPLAQAKVNSPILVAGTVTGGGWFFEASFPVKVLDADGTVLGQGTAQATPPQDWMSTGTVTFAASITFTAPHSATGTIVLSKDNPSGLPQNDMSFEVPIRF